MFFIFLLACLAANGHLKSYDLVEFLLHPRLEGFAGAQNAVY